MKINLLDYVTRENNMTSIGTLHQLEKLIHIKIAEKASKDSLYNTPEKVQYFIENMNGFELLDIFQESIAMMEALNTASLNQIETKQILNIEDIEFDIEEDKILSEYENHEDYVKSYKESIDDKFNNR